MQNIEWHRNNFEKILILNYFFIKIIEHYRKLHDVRWTESDDPTSITWLMPWEKYYKLYREGDGWNLIGNCFTPNKNLMHCPKTSSWSYWVRRLDLLLEASRYSLNFLDECSIDKNVNVNTLDVFKQIWSQSSDVEIWFFSSTASKNIIF